MQIGLLYSGDDQTRIHGSAVTTHYLKKAFEFLGHKVWRWSATHGKAIANDLVSATDMVIAEGVGHFQIPQEIWLKNHCIILWHLSELFYDAEALLKSPFHAIATNSGKISKFLSKRRRCSAYIELAAPRSFATARPEDQYRALSAYVGCYPHKNEKQLSLVLRPASQIGMEIWGYGWEASQYAKHHRGILPLRDIGSLYQSVGMVLALTEERQKSLGMINNRIYEALAAGAFVISEPYAALAGHELGQYITFASSQKDVLDALRNIRERDLSSPRNKCAQEIAVERHSYEERAKSFLKLHEECC